MSKRSADTQMTKEGDGGQGPLGFSVAEQIGGPQRATAAQLANRRMAKPRGGPRRPGQARPPGLPPPGTHQSIPPIAQSNTSNVEGSQQQSGAFSFGQSTQQQGGAFSFGQSTQQQGGAFSFGTPATDTNTGASTFGQPAKDTQSQTGSLMFGQSAQNTQEPAKAFSFGPPATDSPQQAKAVTFGQQANDTQQQAGSLMFGQPPKDTQKQASIFSFGSTNNQQPNASQGNQASASFPPTGATTSFNFTPAQPKFDYQKNPFAGEIRPVKDIYKDGFFGKIFHHPSNTNRHRKTDEEWAREGNEAPKWAPQPEGPLIPTEPLLPADHRLPGVPAYPSMEEVLSNPKPNSPKLAPGIQLNASSKPKTNEASSSTFQQPSALEQLKTITSPYLEKQQLVSGQGSESVDSDAQTRSATTPSETQPQVTSNISGQPKPQQQQTSQAPAPSTPKPVPSTPRPAPILTFSDAMKATQEQAGVFTINTPSPRTREQREQQQPSQAQAQSTPKPAETQPQAASNVSGQSQQHQQLTHGQAPSTPKPAKAPSQPTSNVFAHLQQTGTLMPGEAPTSATNNIFGHLQEPKGPVRLRLNPPKPPAEAQSQATSSVFGQTKQQQPVDKRQEQQTHNVPTEQSQPSMPKQDAKEQQQEQPAINVSDQQPQSKQPPSNVFGQQQEFQQPTSNAFAQQQEPQQPTDDSSNWRLELIQDTNDAFGQQHEPQKPTNDSSGQQQESMQATSNAFGQHQELHQPTNDVFPQQENSQQSTSNFFGQNQEPPYNPFGQQEVSQQPISNFSGQHHEPQQPTANLFSQRPFEPQEQTQAASNGFDLQAMSNSLTQAASNGFDLQALSNSLAHQEEQKQSPNVSSSQQENNMFFEQHQQPASGSFSQQQLPANSNMFSQPQQQQISSVFGQQQQPTSDSIFSHLQQQPVSGMFSQQQQQPTSDNIFSHLQQQPVSNMFSQQQQPTSDHVFSHLQQQPVSNMFNQQQQQQQQPEDYNMFSQAQQQPMNDNMFSQAQQQPMNNNMFSQAQQPMNDNMFSQAQQQPMNNNIFSQAQQQPIDSNMFSQAQQQSGSNMFSQQEQQPTQNMFHQLQSQPASSSFSLPTQQNTSNMFSQFQPQQTSNMFGHEAQQLNGNISGQVQSQQTGNVFDQQAHQASGNVFGQLQLQPMNNSFGLQAQQSNGDMLGQAQQGMISNIPEQQQYQGQSTPVLQDGHQTVASIPQRNEDQQHQQHIPSTSMSLNQSPPTEPEPTRKESNPFLTSVESFMEFMDSGEPLDGIEAEDEEMNNDNTQRPTDAEDEQMLSPNPSPERRRANNQDQVMSHSDKETLSPETGSLTSRMTHAVNNPDRHQFIQQQSGDSSSTGNMTQSKLVQTSSAHINAANESHTGRQNENRPVTSSGPANFFSNINMQSTSQPSPSPILPALPSVTSPIPPRSDVAAAPSNQGEIAPSPPFSTRSPASLPQPSQPSARTHDKEFGKLPAIPVDFIDEEKRQFTTAWRLRYVEVGLRKFFRHKLSAADMGTALKYFEIQKRIILAANGGNMPSLAGSKRKPGVESQEDRSDEPPQKRTKSIHLPNGASPAQVVPVSDSQHAQVVGVHDERHVDGKLATKEADKGTMAEKRKAGEELSREEHDSGKKARIADQSETSNIFKGIVGKKNDANSTKSTALTNGVAAPPASDKSIPHTSKPAELEVPKAGTDKSIQCAPNASKPPVFKVPTFSTGSSTNWTAQFGKTAAKSAEQLAKEEKAKRKAEEFDSDEDDEAQWERDYEERLRAKRQKAVTEKAQGMTKLVNGKFVFVSSDDAAKTDPKTDSNNAKDNHASQTAPQTATQTAPQTAPQTATQTAPQTAPQTATQTAPQTAPQTATQTAPQTAPKTAPQTAPKTAPQTAPQHGQNIFGSLPGGQSIFRFKPSGENTTAKLGSQSTISRGASGNESGAEDSRTGDADDEGEDGHEGDDDGETDDSQEKLQATYSKATKNPFGSRSSHTATQHSQDTTDLAKQSSSGGLFDRVSKDKEGNLIREIPNTPSVLLATDSAAVKKAPFGSLKFGSTSKEKEDTPVEPSKEKEVRTVDHTWKPENFIKFPIKFSDSPPTVNVTSPSPSKQPFTGLFGVPKTNNTTETPAQPVSVLFSGTPQKAPNIGFNFGFTPANPTVASLAPPSNEASAVTSRATTPGVTTGESANESTADAQGEEDEGEDRQIDLTAGGPGEEDEDVVFEIKAKAMVYDRPSSKWDVKGVGFLRVLKNRDTGKTRVLMRQDPSGKVMLNASLTWRLTYESPQSKHVRFPFASESGRLEAWTLRVGKDEDAKELVKVLEENKSN